MTVKSRLHNINERKVIYICFLNVLIKLKTAHFDRESLRANGLIKGKVGPTSRAPQQLKLGGLQTGSKVALRYSYLKFFVCEVFAQLLCHPLEIFE